MLDVLKFEKRYDYTHMSPADKAIWERFIDQYPQAYDSCQYDFHVGEPPAFNTLYDNGDDKEQDKLYRLRIDVVGRYGSSVDIIEVKPNAKPPTIGQVENYKILYERDEEPLGKVNMVIITDRELPNMDYLCKEKGVKLIVV
jgi:hypothetical protein